MDSSSFQRRPAGLTKVCLAKVFDQMKLSDPDNSFVTWSDITSDVSKIEEQDWNTYCKPLHTSTPKS